MRNIQHTPQNALIIVTCCLMALWVLFTIDGYLEYKEEQRNKSFLGHPVDSTVADNGLDTYFLKGINPSY